MSSRHRAREVALQILYRYDLDSHASGSPAPTGMMLADELKKHFDHFQVSEPLREFAGQLVAGTLIGRTDLDALLEKHAAHWKVSRMGFIDRNLLRMAIYELKSFEDIPHKVTIDEAIELSKQFGTADSPAFVNGILDAVHTELSKA